MSVSGEWNGATDREGLKGRDLNSFVVSLELVVSDMI